jgi:ubiquinone/menaquinone biosynthesis C-methylase UbiE
MAKEKGFNSEGFDSNDELLQNCKSRGLNVKYGTFSEKLPYKNDTFDAIYCSNVFEHLYDPEFALFELIRILNKDGILIISVPEANNILFYNDWTHITHFSSQTFENLIMCLDNINSYKIYRRHFPVLVRHLQNPIIKFGNLIIEKGILAKIFTHIFEKCGYVHRHDLVLRIKK